MRYTAIIFDDNCNAGETDIEADSLPEAIVAAREWAQAGNWNQPGSVDVRLSWGDGESHRFEIAVGETP